MCIRDRFSIDEAIAEGIRPRVYSPSHLERAAIQRAFAERLLERNVLLLHGSTVAVDGRAYLFTAKCGTGKSTHTRLWCQAFGERAQMVNDDKPFLAVTAGGVIAYGSPWCGKHGLGNPISAPLQGICLLHRGAENRIFPLAPEDALSFLRSQAFVPRDRAKLSLTEQLLQRLTDQVPLWEMECNKELQAALVAYHAMKEGK